MTNAQAAIERARRCIPRSVQEWVDAWGGWPWPALLPFILAVWAITTPPLERVGVVLGIWFSISLATYLWVLIRR